MSMPPSKIDIYIDGQKLTYGLLLDKPQEGRRAIFLLAQSYGKHEHHSVADLECGNIARVLDGRQTALREAAANRFPEDPRSTRIHALHYKAVEKTPNYLAWKYVWRNIQQKHIDWLYQLRGCGFISGLIVDYDSEYQGDIIPPGQMAIVGEAGNDEIVYGGTE